MSAVGQLRLRRSEPAANTCPEWDQKRTLVSRSSQCFSIYSKFGGKDLRGSTLETRKRELAKLLHKVAWPLQLNDHIAEPGDVVFRHACKLGFEGIVSKRLGSFYRSGRSRDWIKIKNPVAPAV